MPADSSDTDVFEWLKAGFSAADAKILALASVPITLARQWVDGGIDVDDAVEFIRKGVPQHQIMELHERGIETWQVTRSDAGFDVELEPWQEDPLAQLPEVVAPGRFRITLWSTVPWDDSHIENQVSLDWDGGHTVEWSVLSGAGLSVMSEVYAGGIAGWPNGKDIVASYSGGDGQSGFTHFAGAALTVDGADGASDPKRWLRFAESLVGLAEELLNSEFDEFEEDDDEPDEESSFDTDQMLRMYLGTSNSDGVVPEFYEWLKTAKESGAH